MYATMPRHKHFKCILPIPNLVPSVLKMDVGGRTGPRRRGRRDHQMAAFRPVIVSSQEIAHNVELSCTHLCTPLLR